MQIIFSVVSGLDNPAYAMRELKHGIAWGEDRSWRMGHCGALTGDSGGMDTMLTWDTMLIPSHSPVDTVLSGMGYQIMGYALDWTMGAWEHGTRGAWIGINRAISWHQYETRRSIVVSKRCKTS